MDIVTLQNVKKYFVIGGQVKALDGISHYGGFRFWKDNAFKYDWRPVRAHRRYRGR